MVKPILLDLFFAAGEELCNCELEDRKVSVVVVVSVHVHRETVDRNMRQNIVVLSVIMKLGTDY